MTKRITWRYNKENVYVGGVYAGYIDCLGDDAWYGNVYTTLNPTSTMEHFGVTYGKDKIIAEIKAYIKANLDAVYKQAKYIEEINHKK